jgi:peptide/nickel transport system ATP-binding protein/oligopeptide transport system ATP-binding protein
VLTGDLPSPASPPSGCRFRTRCQKFAGELTDDDRSKCIDVEPPLVRIGAARHDHLASGHYARVRAVL